MFPDTCRNIEIARPFCGHFGYILNQIWLKFDYISAPFTYHLASFEASRKCVPVLKPKALNQCEAVQAVVRTWGFWRLAGNAEAFFKDCGFLHTWNAGVRCHVQGIFRRGLLEEAYGRKVFYSNLQSSGRFCASSSQRIVCLCGWRGS
jgi:hypothetical protein